MGIMHREVRVEWRPAWWDRSTPAMMIDAARIIGSYPATHVSVEQDGFHFTLAVHPLDGLGAHDPRLARLRHEVEALGE